MYAVSTPALLIAAFLLASCGSLGPGDQQETADVKVHYIEIVSDDASAQCAALEGIHGRRFGSPVEDLGGARVAELPDGTLLGVRAPLAVHEQPIVRPYLEVEDIARALEQAEAAGAEVAYPPTQQGETGIWAIYLLDGLQFGLWQAHPQP